MKYTRVMSGANLTDISVPNATFLSAALLQLLCVVLSGLSVYVFYRMKRSSHSSTLTKGLLELVLLSVLEILFAGSGSSFVLLFETLSPYPVVLKMLWTAINATLCMRNNWIAVVTLIRCLVVVLPIRTKGVFTSRRILLAFLLLSTLSLAVACQHTMACMTVNPPLCVMLFVLQAAVPVLVVLLTTVTTLLTVHFSSEELQTSMAPASQRALIMRRRVMLLFVSLGVSFAILEIPSLIKVCLDIAQVPWALKHSGILNVITMHLLALDCILNFFIFIGRLALFRRIVRQTCFFLCKHKAASKRRSQIATSC